ncbi:MAG: disulfide bond oxidoreductase family protein [Candidatus Parcubacteria bacterium]|jgi:cytochrome c-type biogenesis protein
MTEGAAMKPGRWDTFLASVFFVLGFSVVFSLVGVLLQTTLSASAYAAQEWLGRVGGIIIIAFGLFTMGIWTPEFLMREHTFAARSFSSRHLTSFVFGAAFAVGWTPCVSAALGAILVLASTQATSAFVLLVAYTLGIGIPFLIVGLFAGEAAVLIRRAGSALIWIQRVFGLLLVVLGILIFAGELNRIANLEFLANFLGALNLVSGAGGNIMEFSFVNLGIAFIAGLGSFLSPCILPLIPGFLSYLATTSARTGT